MRILIAAVAMMVLAGCATSPLPAENADPVPGSRVFAFQAPLEGKSSLIVTRDKGFVGSACNTNISIDGTRAAAIGSGETANFHLTPGEHMISASSCGSGLKEREVSIPTGSTKRYRISIDSAMSLDLSPTAF
ncbi:hypothetical protein AO391_26435 [Pseudomonas marginalis ICMP 9505]|nr:hypothetical protein AO391_26435 [Pseudomonas marginalis ICMP 9505]